MTLGIATELDVDRIHVTHHAVERYLERRGLTKTPDMRAWAEAKLRELLGGATTQRPPIDVVKGDPIRRYKASGFMFIVSADHGALITFYPWRAPQKKGKGGGRQARMGGTRRARHELADWDWDDEVVA